MAKRGRKPSEKRKGYWYENESKCFEQYLIETDQEKKDEMFNTVLKPALTKMIEAIIRRYNLYPPDETFKETFDDTMSFLISKISHFNPNAGYKSYSYCGTVIKNYLIYKINAYSKNISRNTSYDSYDPDEMTSIIDTIKYSYDNSAENNEFVSDLMKRAANIIEREMKGPNKVNLTPNQIKVGKALVELLTNWDELFAQIGNDKFNKSSILYFLRERTSLPTKDIRDAMKIYKDDYYELKKAMLEE